MEARTRYTRAIDVGVYEDKVGFTLYYGEDTKEHFLFSRDVARDLALKLLRVIDRTPTPLPRRPGDDIGISDGGTIRLTDPI